MACRAGRNRSAVQAWTVNCWRSRAAPPLRRHMLATASSKCADSTQSRLWAVVITPVPMGFVRTRMSPGCAPALVKIRFGVHLARHRQAVLRFLVGHRVAAGDHRSGFLYLVRAAQEDAAQDVQVEVVRESPRDLMRRAARLPRRRRRSERWQPQSGRTCRDRLRPAERSPQY